MRFVAIFVQIKHPITTENEVFFDGIFNRIFINFRPKILFSIEIATESGQSNG